MPQFENNNLITKLYLDPATRSSSSLNYPNNIWVCISKDVHKRVHTSCYSAAFIGYFPNTNMC